MASSLTNTHQTPYTILRDTENAADNLCTRPCPQEAQTCAAAMAATPSGEHRDTRPHLGAGPVPSQRHCSHISAFVKNQVPVEHLLDAKIITLHGFNSV